MKKDKSNKKVVLRNSLKKARRKLRHKNWRRWYNSMGGLKGLIKYYSSQKKAIDNES